jgi:hypothetical protein
MKTAMVSVRIPGTALSFLYCRAGARDFDVEPSIRHPPGDK